jgi:hypothetical protein
LIYRHIDTEGYIITTTYDVDGKSVVGADQDEQPGVWDAFIDLGHKKCRSRHHLPVSAVNICGVRDLTPKNALEIMTAANSMDVRFQNHADGEHQQRPHVQ